MIPTSFDESNHFLNPPDDMTVDECCALSVCMTKSEDGLPLVISCWKLTVAELEEIKQTGRVYLGVHGHTMPPVFLAVANPFTGGGDA